MQLSKLLTVGALLGPFFVPSSLRAAEIPEFLPAWFAPALTIDDTALHPEPATVTDGVKRAAFGASSIHIVIEDITCSKTTCPILLQKTVAVVDRQASAVGGNFTSVESVQFAATWRTGGTVRQVFAFELPRHLLVWSMGGAEARFQSVDAYGRLLQELVDRLRTEEALQTDNVEFGHWAVSARAYASALKTSGDNAGSRKLRDQVRAWSPTDYAALMEDAEEIATGVTARQLAEAVLANAEDPALTRRAETLLGRKASNVADLPILGEPREGLRALFVLLPPSDAALVSEAAAAFTTATGIPSQVARLPTEWSYQGPGRLLFQPNLEQTLVETLGHDVDTSGWDRGRWAAAMTDAARGTTALVRFQLRKLAAGMADRPTQFDVVPLLDAFAAATQATHDGAPRSIFVGVTDVPIYLGQNNYVFSASTGRTPVSVLSTAMMRAATWEETLQSRPRLVQRLAKEMVPAVLRTLDIPRPVDPTDPYSYSDGVQRLDQKTLVLSAPTREAILTAQHAD